MADAIFIRGAREHNLKDIDVVIPRDKMVVITGVLSVISGIITMVWVLGWFAQPEDGSRNIAVYALAFQFAFMYLPLMWFVLRVVFRRR